jgi:hypothetical protein
VVHAGFVESSSDRVLTDIKKLLDERIEVEGSEEMSMLERVRDVVVSYEAWSDLAFRRLHEIHRLTDSECVYCSQYLDGAQ